MTDGLRTVAQIAEAIAAEFNVPIGSVTADTCRFMEELAGIGAITFRTIA
jgi:hypothetical protein